MAATPPPRRAKKYGQDFPEGPPGPQSQVSEPGIQPLPSLRSPARLLPQVRPLPDLPARGRPRGLRPRHDEVELVAMHTDPIADYLTRIRNAIRAGHDDGEIPASTQKMELSRILKEQGYITDFHKKPATVGETIEVTLKYTEDRRPVILGIERVSRPGRARYGNPKRVPGA